jgi:hypothetical protein
MVRTVLIACLALTSLACSGDEAVPRQPAADQATATPAARVQTQDAAAGLTAAGLLTPALVREVLGLGVLDADESERGPGIFSLSWPKRAETAPGAMPDLTPQNYVGLFIHAYTRNPSPREAYEQAVGPFIEQRAHETFTDIGDAAVWVPSMHQLSVLAGRHLMHVSVNLLDRDVDELAVARTLATRIIDRLD